MQYEKYEFHSFLVLRIRGDLSAGGEAEEMIQDISDELRLGRSQFLFDLESAHFINSSGVRVLLRARQMVETREGLLGIVNLRPAIRQVLRDILILDMFPVYPSLQEAGKVAGKGSLETLTGNGNEA